MPELPVGERSGGGRPDLALCLVDGQQPPLQRRLEQRELLQGKEAADGDGAEDHGVERPVDGDEAQDDGLPEELAPAGHVQRFQLRQRFALGSARRSGGRRDPRVAAQAPGEATTIGKVHPDAGMLGEKGSHRGGWSVVPADATDEGLGVPASTTHA